MRFRCTRPACRHRWTGRLVRAPRACPRCRKYTVASIPSGGRPRSARSEAQAAVPAVDPNKEALARMLGASLAVDPAPAVVPTVTSAGDEGAS
jgi:hypothetical protein